MTSALSLLDNLKISQALGIIPSGLFVVDLEMRIVCWNHAAERITGYAAEEAVGRHCSFLQGIPCGERCGLYNAEKKKPDFGTVCTILSKSGERVHLLKNVDYLCDGNGRVVGGIESFLDITRERQLEDDLRGQAEELDQRVAERTAELARSEARLQAVLDTMDDLAYSTNSDYKITMMNRAIRDLYGERVGESCFRVLHDSDQLCGWCVFDRVLRGETVREERVMTAGHHLYEIIHSPLDGEDGSTQKLSICRDITERKKTEQQLLEANHELDAFSHSISHDLRGLLVPVVTYMDFLRMQYGDGFDPQVLQVLTEVERQSERAITLLDDLLDLARVGRIDTSDQLIEIDKLIAEAQASHAGETELPRLELAVGPLKPMTIPESLVFQLYSNLIGNALRYAGPDGGPIEVGCREQEGLLTYFVRDHGPGVAPEERERIFEIFHRGSTSRKIRGTGVGLAIVRKIVKRYQGAVWVEETPGGGATFCFTLPRQP